MTAQVGGLFDTPIVVDELPNAAMVNAALKPLILARRAQGPGVTISNIGGWQSDHDVAEWGGEPLQYLVHHIIGLANRHCVDIVSPGAPRHRWATDIWANVSPPQASNQMHTHPGAYWSAVYYVDDGSEQGDGALGGELIIEDPRMPMILMTMPNLRLRGANGSVHEPQLKMKVRSGRIILFPAWLSHGVATHEGSRDRISIAINLLAVPLNPA
ncbi:MAG: TIGR02466 family protein [Sphingopyxis sp.]|nr:TIGR02466 family protein [Sphingopyxis sp.]